LRFQRVAFAASKFPCLTIDGNADSHGTSAVFQTVTLSYAVCTIFPSKSFVFDQIKLLLQQQDGPEGPVQSGAVKVPFGISGVMVSVPILQPETRGFESHQNPNCFQVFLSNKTLLDTEVLGNWEATCSLQWTNSLILEE
jgi:hypothetical protein